MVNAFDSYATEEERACNFLRVSALTALAVMALIAIGEVFFR